MSSILTGNQAEAVGHSLAMAIGTIMDQYFAAWQGSATPPKIGRRRPYWRPRNNHSAHNVRPVDTTPQCAPWEERLASISKRREGNRPTLSRSTEPHVGHQDALASTQFSGVEAMSTDFSNGSQDDTEASPITGNSIEEELSSYSNNCGAPPPVRGGLMAADTVYIGTCTTTRADSAYVAHDLPTDWSALSHEVMSAWNITVPPGAICFPHCSKFFKNHSTKPPRRIRQATCSIFMANIYARREERRRLLRSRQRQAGLTLLQQQPQQQVDDLPATTPAPFATDDGRTSAGEDGESARLLADTGQQEMNEDTSQHGQPPVEQHELQTAAAHEQLLPKKRRRRRRRCHTKSLQHCVFAMPDAALLAAFFHWHGITTDTNGDEEDRLTEFEELVDEFWLSEGLHHIMACCADRQQLLKTLREINYGGSNSRE